MKVVNYKAYIALFTLILTSSLIFCSSSSSKDDGAPSVRVRINKMESEGVDKKIVDKISNNLLKKLQEFKGPNRVVAINIDGVSKSANRQLIGRISKLGKKYVIVLKVVEGEKGKLLFNETAIVKEGDIDDTIEDMAEKVSEKEDVW